MSITSVTREFTEQKRETPPQSGQLQQRPVSVISSSSSSSSVLTTALAASHEKFFKILRDSQIIGTPFVPTVQRNGSFNSHNREACIDTFKLCRELPNGNETQTLAEVNRHFAILSRTYHLLIQKQDHAEDFAFHPVDHFDLKYRLAQSYSHQGASDAAVGLLDLNISAIASSWNERYSSLWNKSVSLRASIVSGPKPPERVHELVIPSVKMKIKYLVDSGDEFNKIGQTGLAALYYEMALKEHKQMREDRAKAHLPALRGIDSLKRSSIRQFLIDYYLESAPLIMPIEPQEAIKIYHKLLKLDPKPEVFKILLEIYTKQKVDAVSRDMIATRILSLKKIIDLVGRYGDPKYKSDLPEMRNELFHCHLERGRKYLKEGRFSTAVSSFKEALDNVERGNCLVDANTLTALKNELFKSLVAYSLSAESQGVVASALEIVREALEFQKVHLLAIDTGEIEALLKRNQELSAKANLIQV